MRRPRPVILCLAISLLLPGAALPAQQGASPTRARAQAAHGAQTARGIVQEIRKDRVRLRALFREWYGGDVRQYLQWFR